MNLTKIFVSPNVNHASTNHMSIADKEGDTITSAADKNTLIDQHAAMNARMSTLAAKNQHNGYETIATCSMHYKHEMHKTILMVYWNCIIRCAVWTSTICCLH
ncbi:hypothetical protein KP509_14G068000 [Ceratopteris richardii]|uniref:Uncharacterized protein n=1 Tax=Ceratopteris richardii TaxID=49495 RepID=A0A8T2TAH4_CERRI|nr:hypothetical protein KP509_14G068000 [Ceratopteris richardii]